MKLIIDPPEGWRYGFPKEVPPDQMNGGGEFVGDMTKYLTDNGYPAKLIEEYGKVFYVRFWYEE